MSTELIVPNDMVHPLCMAGASLGSGVRSAGGLVCGPTASQVVAVQERSAVLLLCTEVEFCVPVKHGLCFLFRL